MKAESWNEVERALDARRSPFEERGLAAQLAHDPEAAAAVRRLTGRLEALARQTPGSFPWRLPALAAAAAALLFALFALRNSGGDAPRIVNVRLSIQDERYEPRLARVERASMRVLGWTTTGGRL